MLLIRAHDTSSNACWGGGLAARLHGQILEGSFRSPGLIGSYKQGAVGIVFQPLAQGDEIDGRSGMVEQIFESASASALAMYGSTVVEATPVLTGLGGPAVCVEFARERLGNDSFQADNSAAVGRRESIRNSVARSRGHRRCSWLVRPARFPAWTRAAPLTSAPLSSMRTGDRLLEVRNFGHVVGAHLGDKLPGKPGAPVRPSAR